MFAVRRVSALVILTTLAIFAVSLFAVSRAQTRDLSTLKNSSITENAAVPGSMPLGESLVYDYNVEDDSTPLKNTLAVPAHDTYIAPLNSEVVALLNGKPANLSRNSSSPATNHPPLAQSDSYTIHRERQMQPIENDSDPDVGDSISTDSIVAQPQHGTWNRYSTNGFNYWPDYGYVGSDSFTYKVCDNWGACSIGMVTLTIVNQPPVVGPDDYNVHGGFIVAPSHNDTDPEGDWLANPSILSPPGHGTFTVYNEHNFNYTANFGYVGPDSFTYRICDNLGACSNGTVNITVVNQPPVAVPDFYTVYGALQMGPGFNDTDPEGDWLANPSILTQPAHGTLSLINGQVSNYTTDPGYVGSDSFTYRICDNLGACSVGTVTLRMPGEGENDGTMSCNAFAGEPVNVTNGNMYVQQSDYQLPGVGHPIEITRTYNSNSQRLALFGRGWTTPYDESITAYGGNQARLNQPDGRAIYLNRPAGSSGVLTPVEGDFHGSLIENGGNGFTLTMKDGSVHQFNSAGKLLSLVDRYNNTTSLTYDSNGYLASIADSSARVLTLTTNVNGQVVSISDAIDTIANYTYGGGNQLLSVTYADNSAFQFAYDVNFRLTSVSDALGNVLEAHTYDWQGRALSSEKHGGVERYALNYVSDTQTDVTDALGHITKYTIDKSRGRNVVTRVEGLCSCGGGASQVQTWTYDSQLNVTAKTDALTHSETFTYDGNGNRLTQTDATGTVTFTYNEFGEVLTRTDQMNGVTTNTYDAQGGLLTTNDALDNTTTLTYDARGQLRTVTDGREKVTTFTWDTGGRLTERKDALNHTTTFAYDARARLTGVTDALSRTTTYEYDQAGRMKKVIYPDMNFVLFTYDLAGRRTKVRDPRGNETTFAYDSAYRLTSQTDALNQTSSSTYDLMSNLTSTTDALSRVTNYKYDDFNRLKKVIYPPATTGATRLEETVEYDAAGNVSKKTDTAARDTTFLYDAADRLTKTTDPALKATQFEYNARSQRTAVVDALNQRYTFAHDALGRTTETSRAGVSMSYSYDAVGNPTKRTDYNGAVTDYTYDDLNRLTTIAYPDATSATYGYDSLSHLTSATNQNGTVTLGYDQIGRASGTTDVWGQTLTYAYDANGNRTGLSVGGSSLATYQYNAVNRISKLTDSGGAQVIYGYDVTNQITSRLLPNGVATSYEYDGLSRLTTLRDVKGAAVIGDRQYEYNTANQITQLTDAQGAHGYGYDVVDRLTSGSSGETSGYYSYDEVGNRTASSLSNYSYGPFNRLGSVGSFDGAEGFSHDANGNRVSQGSALGSSTYTYDFENRLTRAQVTVLGASPHGQQTSVTTAVNYKYDALGRRIQRTTSAGANERYVYDGQDVIRDLNANGSVATDYLNGPGIDNKIRQTNAANGSLYYTGDHLGSTQALTDASGNVVEQIAYDSFGNGGSALTRYGYTGREHDPVTNLMYYRARFYDPQVGRFISEDPIGFGGLDVNLYGYVHNNPLHFNDPSGLRRCHPLLGAIMGGLLGAGTGAGAGGVLGAIAGGSVAAVGGTFVLPVFGTAVGAAGGTLVGAQAGAFVGSAIGAGVGIVAGIDWCNGDDACDTMPMPRPRPAPIPLVPPLGPNNPPRDPEKDEECYNRCQHLLGGSGDYGASYIKCYRQCKGTL
jgi:RHS repeat-associated protein